ncbi:hypothetical protein [Oceanicoccus sp. KOV_DT_Chl]|uniref:hypothetical protein n=1 Tax=Oceanicoccus sp. KOV_DT_Chl TaxID=1904639 RepID=UPI000C7E20A3|nr:hypothetical protein [Oceanicoccus sp. KOV_DT_Chl]
MITADELNNYQNSLFEDRRHGSISAEKLNHPCRRRTFGQTDTAPWWLKVDYVSQHLKAVPRADKNSE